MLVFVSSATGALASDGAEGKRPTPSAGLSLELTEPAKIDGTDASVGYKEYCAGLDWQFLLINIDHREYEWKNNETFGGNPGVKPWETLTRLAFGLQYYYKFDEKWGV